MVSVGQNVVKLVITELLPTTPRYATLSYCWGSKSFTTLTRDNLSLFLHHIPPDELPPTFCDAIDASRRLGIDYIWIDALCIIQNDADSSPSDWEKESGRMAAIYGGSFVTLAATTATSVHEGFLHRPQHNLYSGGFIAKVTTDNCCRIQNFHSQQVYPESTTNTHLATRAWALQERLLSSRIIYFGDRGLFWECREHISSEYLPTGLPDLLFKKTIGREEKPWDWSIDIVSEYSKTKLTRDSDRLPALSGIAARQQQLNGDEYLAGMWKESLTAQLPWQQIGEKSPRPAWRAPTWSWTSIDGQSLCWAKTSRRGCDQLNAFIQVLNAWTKVSGPDPFGAVVDGELTVSCAHLIRGHIYTYGSVEEETEDQVQLISARLPVFPVRFDCVEKAADQSHRVVYLLPVLEEPSGRVIYMKKTRETIAELVIRGLVLQAYDDSERSQHFQRIGSFRFRNKWNLEDDGGKDFYQDFKHVLGYSTSTTSTSTAGAGFTAAAIPATPAPENQSKQLVIVIK